MKKVLTVLAIVLFIGMNVTIVAQKGESSKISLNSIFKVALAGDEIPKLEPKNPKVTGSAPCPNDAPPVPTCGGDGNGCVTRNC